MFNQLFCRKLTYCYSFRKRHQRIYEQYYFYIKKENIDSIKKDIIVKLPRVQKLGPKLKFKKFGIKTIFTSGGNLKNLIGRKKVRLLPQTFPVSQTKNKRVVRN